uniref:Uncharacterized protein n=1 Tax=Oryza punctata TaxID=4537 RepID=A0A0E0L9Z6_ORYPU
MVMRQPRIVVLVILVAIMAFLVASSSARPLGVGGGGGGGVSSESILQLLRRVYLQQLGSGPSCGTNSSNGGCPPPSGS